MKNILKIQYILIFLLFYSCSSETVPPEQTSSEPIITFQDSLSYTMGVNIGQNLPETEINHDLLIEGLRDFWNNEEPRLNAPTRLDILRAFNITLVAAGFYHTIFVAGGESNEMKSNEDKGYFSYYKTKVAYLRNDDVEQAVDSLLQCIRFCQDDNDDAYLMEALLFLGRRKHRFGSHRSGGNG